MPSRSLQRNRGTVLAQRSGSFQSYLADYCSPYSSEVLIQGPARLIDGRKYSEVFHRKAYCVNTLGYLGPTPGDPYQYTQLHVNEPIRDFVNDIPPDLYTYLIERRSSFIPDWDKAVSGLIPKIVQDFNAINFALEFSDLADLLKSTASTFLQFSKKFKTLEKNLRNTKSAAKAAASARLQWQLGIKPTVSDMKSLRELASNKYELVIDLITSLQNGKPFRRAFSQKISFEGKSYHSYFGTPYTVSYRYTGKMKVVLSGKLKANCLTNRVGIILALSGIDLSWATVWNAVPFSFIIDYFIDVGGALSNTDLNYLETELSNCMISYKHEGYLQYFPDGSEPIPFSVKPECVVKYSLYERLFADDARFDGYNVESNFKPPNLGQLWNIVALIVSIFF